MCSVKCKLFPLSSLRVQYDLVVTVLVRSRQRKRKNSEDAGVNNVESKVVSNQHGLLSSSVISPRWTLRHSSFMRLLRPFLK